jgi:hypothetical protein
MSLTPLRLGKTVALSIGTTAVDVAVAGGTFIIQNTHATQILYFKEKKDVAVVATTGYKLAAGTTSPIFSADTLSILGSGATTTGVLIYLE